MPKIVDKYIKFGLGPTATNDADIPSTYLTPVNFVPSQVNSEGNDKISAYLKGIDNALGSVNTGNIDGGSPFSVYGGNEIINGGTP